MDLVLDSQAGPRDSVASYDIVGNESVRPRNVVPLRSIGIGDTGSISLSAVP
jgi:hypothetical protein